MGRPRRANSKAAVMPGRLTKKKVSLIFAKRSTSESTPISAPLWRRARTEESRLGDSIQRFGRRSSRSHEPAGERFDGGAPNRLDKDNWTGYQPQRPIHRRASLRLQDYLERYTQRFR